MYVFVVLLAKLDIKVYGPPLVVARYTRCATIPGVAEGVQVS